MIPGAVRQVSVGDDFQLLLQHLTRVARETDSPRQLLHCLQRPVLSLMGHNLFTYAEETETALYGGAFSDDARVQGAIDGLLDAVLANPVLELEWFRKKTLLWSRNAGRLARNPSVVFWWSCQDPTLLEHSATLYLHLPYGNHNPLWALLNPQGEQDVKPSTKVLVAIRDALQLHWVPRVLGEEVAPLPIADRLEQGKPITLKWYSMQMVAMMQSYGHAFRIHSDLRTPLITVMGGRTQWLHDLQKIWSMHYEYQWVPMSKRDKPPLFCEWIRPYLCFVAEVARRIGKPMPVHLLSSVFPGDTLVTP